MFEKFTDRSRKVIALANQEAQRFNHEYIGTEHLLLGLVKEGSGVAANVLRHLDCDLKIVRLEVEKVMKPGPEIVTMGKLPQTPKFKKVIEYAIEQARNLNHNYVGTEHLLLGLLAAPPDEDGKLNSAQEILQNLNLTLSGVQEEVKNLLGMADESTIKVTKDIRVVLENIQRFLKGHVAYNRLHADKAAMSSDLVEGLSDDLGRILEK